MGNCQVTQSQRPWPRVPHPERTQRKEWGSLWGWMRQWVGLNSGHHPPLQELGQVPVPEDPGHLRREGGGGTSSKGFPERSEGPLPHQVDSGRAHTAPEPQGLVAGRHFLKAVVKLRTEWPE